MCSNEDPRQITLAIAGEWIIGARGASIEVREEATRQWRFGGSFDYRGGEKGSMGCMF